MRKKRKDARDEDDPVDHRRSAYKVASYAQDHEGKKFKSGNVVYSFWSASKYVLVLSLMLWWLPMFGQMIAGYVGGRRAGGPWKGIAASIIPVVCLYAVMTAFSNGVFPSHLGGIAIAPAAIGTVLNHNIPFLSPYLHFSSEYIGGFVDGLAAASPYGINTYVLTVAFAYIGGVLAEQSRREIEFTSGAVMSHTTVLVQDPSAFEPRAAVEEGASRGLFSGVGAMLHLPHLPWRGYSAASAGYSSRRRGDAWASANDMQYGDEIEELDEEQIQEADIDYYEPRRNQARQGGHHGHHHSRHNRDPWHQKRRGATNFSAKPRFNYDQYSQRTKTAGYQGGPFRRNKGNYSFTVSPDARSIKRAEKLIDSEWGNRKYSTFRDRSQPRSAEAQPDDQETEAVAVHKREPHRSGNQWDQI